MFYITPYKKKYLIIGVIVAIFVFTIVKFQIRINNLISGNKLLSNKVDEFSSIVVPTCNFGHCPTYRSFNTDDDTDWESVVEVPTTMNKGAGEIWIIDEGKVVFKRATEANIGYIVPGYGLGEHGNDEGTGIFISYASEYDQTGLNPSVWATEEWRYENGNYVLKDTKFEKVE